MIWLVKEHHSQKTAMQTLLLVRPTPVCKDGSQSPVFLLQVRAAIEQHGGLLKRDAAVWLKLWLTKLSEQVSAEVSYARSQDHPGLCLGGTLPFLLVLLVKRCWVK